MAKIKRTRKVKTKSGSFRTESFFEEVPEGTSKTFKTKAGGKATVTSTSKKQKKALTPEGKASEKIKKEPGAFGLPVPGQEPAPVPGIEVQTTPEPEPTPEERTILQKFLNPMPPCLC